MNLIKKAGKKVVNTVCLVGKDKRGGGAMESLGVVAVGLTIILIVLTVAVSVTNTEVVPWFQNMISTIFA